MLGGWAGIEASYKQLLAFCLLLPDIHYLTPPHLFDSIPKEAEYGCLRLIMREGGGVVGRLVGGGCTKCVGITNIDYHCKYICTTITTLVKQLFAISVVVTSNAVPTN